jgi:HEPN domain-containing protein
VRGGSLAKRNGRDLARVLFDRAEGDLLAVERLSTDLQIPDHIVGFHAQQAAEKLLKAVLSHHAISYGRTHDLERLIELVSRNDLPAPPAPDRLVTLTPWAIGLRYGEDPVDPGPLDREAAARLVVALRDWARPILD